MSVIGRFMFLLVLVAGAARCGGGEPSSRSDAVSSETIDTVEVAHADLSDVDETDRAVPDTPTDLPGEGFAPEVPDALDEPAHDVNEPADVPREVLTPVCLAPQLPKSCIVEALEDTGLPTCGPTVTGCFQYGSEEFPQATWLISDYLESLSLGSATFAASWDTLRIDYSNGAWMLSEFLPRPRALYFAPDGKLAAVLDFHYNENSGNWGDYDVARRYYLRYGDGKLVVIRPRFDASPGVWWRLDGFDVTCADGRTEAWNFDAFKPLAYLLFGGEGRSGTSFLPYWTSDGCEMGELNRDCAYQEDIAGRSSCEGASLRVCSRGVSLTVDCAARGKQCVQVPVGYSPGEVYYYHSFCWGGESCAEDYCDGDRLHECWGGVAEIKDCSETGASCVVPQFGVTPAIAMCAQKPLTPCQGAAFQATCDGDTAVRCDYYGYVFRMDCAQVGMRCVVGKDYDGKDWPMCVPKTATQPCGDDFQEGCQGDARRSCQLGTVIVEEDCKARYGKTCKVGTAGAGCVDEDSKSCEYSANNCAGCEGDKVVACGQGGLTVFDACALQGLGPTGGQGRTCYSDGQDGCGYCGQEDAATCGGDYVSACSRELIVHCLGGHQIAWDCAEWGTSTHASGWCNTDQTGTAYCESMANPSCDPATTPSKCQGMPPVAVNCTASKVLVKVPCADEGLSDCRMNASARAVCVQTGAVACDPASFVAACDGAAVQSCNDGFTFATPCPGNWECGKSAAGSAVCHQPGAEPCDEWLFDFRCEQQVAVSCQGGFVQKTDCLPACSMCTCHSDTHQAWCQPGIP